MRSATQEEGRFGVLSYGLYKMFRESLDEYDLMSDVNVWWPQYQRICKKFNERKMESIIKGQVFTMPLKLGKLGVVQFKRKIRFYKDGRLNTKKLVVDWGASQLLWKKIYPNKTSAELKLIKHKPIVYQTNEHTDGRMFKFHWKKIYCNIKNISFYKLTVAQRYKYALGRHIKQNTNIQYCTKF